MEEEEGIVARRTRRKEGEDGAVISVLRVVRVVRSFSVLPIALVVVLVHGLTNAGR
jgi:hypothetical protein